MGTSSFAMKAAIIAVVPLLACSTYYTLERLVDARPVLYLAASLAFPVLLLGLVGTWRTIVPGRANRLLSWASGLAVVMPALLLAAIWL
jgi:hypothetical protein